MADDEKDALQGLLARSAFADREVTLGRSDAIQAIDSLAGKGVACLRIDMESPVRRGSQDPSLVRWMADPTPSEDGEGWPMFVHRAAAGAKSFLTYIYLEPADTESPEVQPKHHLVFSSQQEYERLPGEKHSKSILLVTSLSARYAASCPPQVPISREQSLLTHLQHIRARPAMYIGDSLGSSLEKFIAGWLCCLKCLGLVDPFYDEFRTWVNNVKYPGSGAADAIHWKIEELGEEEALQWFWGCYDEYMSRPADE